MWVLLFLNDFSQPCMNFRKNIFVSFTRLHNLMVEILPHMNYVNPFTNYLLSGYYVLLGHCAKHI